MLPVIWRLYFNKLTKLNIQFLNILYIPAGNAYPSGQLVPSPPILVLACAPDTDQIWVLSRLTYFYMILSFAKILVFQAFSVDFWYIDLKFGIWICLHTDRIWHTFTSFSYLRFSVSSVKMMIWNFVDEFQCKSTSNFGPLISISIGVICLFKICWAGKGLVILKQYFQNACLSFSPIRREGMLWLKVTVLNT